ncbi:MAG: NTP transferase domain-containing protein [Leptospiraceae bacterium]|jgi:NDP-sugar pyrophosphorylase family protein|nr:NTP transferase domain-containing protein [Leptospiraceae bacterium]
MSRRAIILAGGKGTRLRPYTTVLPKPLMPIGDYPILEVIVRQLAQSGFSHITMAVNHQAHLIKAFFQDGQQWNIKIDYSLEDIPLGTMGPLKLLENLPENFLVMNGDVLTDLNFATFFDNHLKTSSIFTIASMLREQVIDYGVLDKDENNFLIGFREKPRQLFDVSMGVYILNKAVLDFVPVNTVFGFDTLMIKFLKENKQVSIHSHSGYWMDIGRPDDYEKAIDEFEAMKNRFFNG